jgi:hypothetical protein
LGADGLRQCVPEVKRAARKMQIADKPHSSERSSVGSRERGPMKAAGDP